MCWYGQKLGVPLYTYFGLDRADAPLTTFSIGIDNPEVTRQKVREAAVFPILKVKVGLDTDEATIAAVRSVTKKPLRVDANEGWKDREEAVRKINWLEKQGVEFIEQPLAADRIEDTKWIRSRVHIPVIADEACQHASDIPKLRDAYDGVNVKLDKSGGLLQARCTEHRSRSLSSTAATSIFFNHCSTRWPPGRFHRAMSARRSAPFSADRKIPACCWARYRTLIRARER